MTSGGHRITTEWLGEEVETLGDLLRPGLGAVIVGINPSTVSVAAGHYYQGRLGQRLWQRLRRVGLVPAISGGYEDDAAYEIGIGFTDIVKRPTRSASELTGADFDHGRNQLVVKLERCRPDLLIFSFKKAAERLVGRFDGDGFVPDLEVAGIAGFVMPGPYKRGDLADEQLASLRQYLTDTTAR